MKLSDYAMSRERGFLSSYEIDSVVLPPAFDEVRKASANLSGLITTGRVRHWLGQLNDPGVEELISDLSDEQVRTLMVHYSFLVQAYVWGEAEAPKSLPANLAVPMVALADDLILTP